MNELEELEVFVAFYRQYIIGLNGTNNVLFISCISSSKLISRHLPSPRLPYPFGDLLPESGIF